MGTCKLQSSASVPAAEMLWHMSGIRPMLVVQRPGTTGSAGEHFCPAAASRQMGETAAGCTHAVWAPANIRSDDKQYKAMSRSPGRTSPATGHACPAAASRRMAGTAAVCTHGEGTCKPHSSASEPQNWESVPNAQVLGEEILLIANARQAREDESCWRAVLLNSASRQTRGTAA